MSEHDTSSEIPVEVGSSRMGWFASGFLVAALLIGTLLFSDGYFGGQRAADTADTSGAIIEAQ